MNDWAGGYLGLGLDLTHITVAKNLLLIRAIIGVELHLNPVLAFCNSA